MTGRERVRLGTLQIDRLSFAGALDAIEALVNAREGGTVFTPNVDHVVVAEHHAAFRQAYAQASLSLVDGMPLLWAAKLLGVALPEKISGSDLILPLMQRAAEKQWRVYLLGAGPGVAEEAAKRLRAEHGVNVVGTDAPMLSLDANPEVDGPVLERIRAARPDLLVVAFGAPKQELWMSRMAEAFKPAVGIGLGASLDFIAGTVRRSPAWMSKVGLEWLYRLSREPKRLWRRYLVNDPKFLAILGRDLRRPRAERLVRLP